MQNLRNILLTKAYNCFYNGKNWMLFNSSCELSLDGEKNYLNVFICTFIFWLVLSNFLDLSKTHKAYCRRGAHPSLD